MGFRYTAPAIYFREQMKQLDFRANMILSDDDLKSLFAEVREKHPQTNVILVTRGQTLSEIWNIVNWEANEIGKYRYGFDAELADLIMGQHRRYGQPAIVMVQSEPGVWMYREINMEKYENISNVMKNIVKIKQMPSSFASVGGKSVSMKHEKKRAGA